MTKPILPAATVVIVRTNKQSPNELQVLLLRRNPELLFAPNMWVFPGGKLDSSDLEQANDNSQQAHKYTAIRETLEETGLDISHQSLLEISHWTTPDFRPKRFATQFFLTELSSSEQVTIDQSEIVEYRWISPTEALSLHQQQKMTMMAPTFVTLSELAKAKTIEQAIEFYQQRETPNYQPQVLELEGQNKLFVYQGDELYQASNQAQANSQQRNRCEFRNGVLNYQYNLD